MLKALRLTGRKAEAHAANSPSDISRVLDNGIQLERSLVAMDCVMDGQIDAAHKLLDGGTHVYNHIALGVLRFLEATVGFEAEAVHEALHTLSAAESVGSKARADAVSRGLRMSSFRPGAEYELVEIETGLMAAVSMFLTESMLEALKALYKLRKTYHALEELRKHVESAKYPATNLDDLYSKFPDKLAEFRKIHKERTNKDEDTLPSQTTDEYIISGVKTCAGLIHLILSTVPPNMSKLLSVVGIWGSRELALKLLWSSIDEYTNVHSSLALLALLQFFDGQFQFRDIELSPEAEEEISKKYAAKPDQVESRSTAEMTPRELEQAKNRLFHALKRTRKLYRHGVLWLLQEGRMVANTDLARGVSILGSDECGPNQMRQVEALLVFDRTFMLLSLGRLDEATENFVKLMELSTWSHSLYMYMAAACHIEQYRADPKGAQAAEHKNKAKEFLRKAPRVVGKKKILGRRMPFDVFVMRKVEQFERQASRHKLDLVDAVGTSPLYEAIYFWNGHARMPQEHVPEVLRQIDYSRDAPLPETPDQEFTRLLLTAVFLRRVDRIDEGYEILDKKLVPQTVTLPQNPSHKAQYHAQKDPWAGPVALYERAIYEWRKNESKGAPQVRRWLTIAADWDEDYELSTRVNMRITGANDRLAIYRL